MAKGYPDYRKFSVPIAVVEGGTGTDAPTLAPGAGIEITGSWPNHTIINTSPASTLGDPVAVAHGGTGTADGSITGTGALTFAAGGAAQDVTLLPSTTGKVVHGSATTTPTIRTWGGGGYSDHTVDGGNVYNIPQLRVTSSLYLTNPLAVAYGGTGEAAPSLVAGSGISITGTWPDQTVTNTSPASTLGDPVTVAHGGTGTATPSLVAGTNITITGTWPHNTIALKSPITGVFTVGDGAGSEIIYIDGGAGNVRDVTFRTAGLARWMLRASDDTEGGANTGSSFMIQRRKDDGTYLGIPLFIRRSDGQVGIGTISPGKALDVSGDIRASLQLISTVATGTAPLAVTSTTEVANLRAATATDLAAGSILSVAKGGTGRGAGALPVYANNAAAIAGGLAVGDFYRTGADPDPVCVVH
jgi:hypothetical protein